MFAFDLERAARVLKRASHSLYSSITYAPALDYDDLEQEALVYCWRKWGEDQFESDAHHDAVIFKYGRFQMVSYMRTMAWYKLPGQDAPLRRAEQEKFGRPQLLPILDAGTGFGSVAGGFESRGDGDVTSIDNYHQQPSHEEGVCLTDLLKELPEIEQRTILLRQAGYEWQEIAELEGKTYQTLIERLRERLVKLGLDPALVGARHAGQTPSHIKPARSYRPNKLPSPETVSQLYWDDGLSQTEIGARYDCSDAAVNQFMKRHGIPARPRPGFD